MSLPDTLPSAVVFGCGGTALTHEEAALFARVRPAGFILFARNCETPAQVRALTAALREAAGVPDALMLIDQEGGRVARLRPPHWRLPPAAAAFGRVWRRDPAMAVEAARASASLMGLELVDLGIDVDCAPVLDLGLPDTTAAIGDRAFAAEPHVVAALGRAVVEGLLAAGVMPVIKHIPGHGRARADSHRVLPAVDAAASLLDASDFVPFRSLADAPAAMTAHVAYAALDDGVAATLSRKVIADYIRGAIGFAGLLISDDICMGALKGTHGERAVAALSAGCDLALHCSGVLSDMQSVADAIPALTPPSASRLTSAKRRRSEATRALDRTLLLATMARAGLAGDGKGI
ncbi:MAG: beta-N-acetylhexosaminidase [Alphaproteobacteria bacterium]